MKISVVTPSFNQGQYLQQAIDSVTQQSHADWEHIIYDGESTDNSIEILEAYQEKYPDKVKFISESDTGQSDALNKGLRKATGDIVVWLSTDDWFEPGAFQAVVKHFKEHSEVGMVYGKCLAYNTTNGQAEEYLLPTQEFSLDALLNETMFMAYITVFWRRELLDSVGYFDESLHFSMDKDYYIRIGLETTIELLPVVLGHFRIHEESKTGGRADQFWKESRAVSRKYGGKFFSVEWQREMSGRLSIVTTLLPRAIKRIIYRFLVMFGMEYQGMDIALEFKKTPPEKTRICIVNYDMYNVSHPGGGVFGGSEVQLFQLVEELRRSYGDGYDIHVVSAIQDIPKLVCENDITYWQVRNTASTNIFVGFWRTLKLLLDFQRINADIYISRSASFEVGLVAWFCKMARKRGVYMTASDIDVNGEFIDSASWLASKSYRYGLHNTTEFFAQNSNHQSLLEKMGAHVTLLPNGFLLRKDELGAIKDSILWVGRAHEMKQPMVFLRLAEAFPDEQFVMICNKGDEVLFTSVQQEVNALSNVTFHDQVDFDVIGEYFSKAKLFVNTSRVEGFPNTFIQAGLHGTPIMSLSANPDNIITEHALGWVAQNSFETLRALLDDILSNPRQLQEAGDNGSQYFRKHHSIERVSKILHEELTRLIQ